MAPVAAEALKLTAESLLELGIIDEIIPEPPGGAHRDYDATMAATKEAITRHIKRLNRASAKRLVERRFDKYAKIGKFNRRKYSSH
jgi:acetyl-CoA carboxylase carboxyl transferase subunit alpha